MEKEFIPYDLALTLKELGFDEPCFAYYLAGGIRFKEYKDSKNKNSAFYNNTVCSIPTFSQAFRWFREKYKIECYVNSYWNENDSSKRTYYANYNYGSDIFYTITKEFETHEEAELECLKKLIEIVQESHKLNTDSN